MDLITKKDLSIFDGFKYYEETTSNFASAFFFMKKKEREAITNFYTFCSYLDDIVDSEISEDNSLEQKRKIIKFWKSKIGEFYSNVHVRSELLPLKRAFTDFKVCRTSLNHLVDGIAADLDSNRKESMDDLYIYCYGVASIVGIVCLYFFGDTSKNAHLYAENLGYALQITNIMRDVAEDAKRDFIYIPQELLKKHKVTEEEIKTGVYSERFANLMEELYSEAKMRYAYAENYLLKCENPKKMRPAEIMKEVYLKLLEMIKAYKFNVFEEKINPSKTAKIFAVLKGMYNS
jgi:phytoene synthase